MNEVYRSVETELLQVEAVMGRTVATVCPSLSTTTAYFLERSGKRIRPLITILTAKLGKADKDIVVKVAAALELIHLGSLVHDDVVDEADLRRGRPSVNSRFGNTSAVLLGDFFFARALGLASEVGLEAVQVVSSVIGNLVEGELDQLERRFDTHITVDDYFARIKRKTALFLAECCRMGGLFSLGNPLSPDKLYQYGLNLGLAYQVKDDLLDFSGEPDQLGKPVMLDLQQGVITLPVIHALEHHPRRDEISAWIRSESTEKWEQIGQCLAETRSLQYAERRARQLIRQAKRQLDGVPDQDAKTALLFLADFVLSRVS